MENDQRRQKLGKQETSAFRAHFAIRKFSFPELEIEFSNKKTKKKKQGLRLNQSSGSCFRREFNTQSFIGPSNHLIPLQTSV